MNNSKDSIINSIINSIIIGLVLIIFFTGCKKEKEKVAVVSHPISKTQTIDNRKIKVVVPAEIKEEWKAVKIAIIDKIANKTNEITVKLGTEYTIANSDIKIKVKEFLPDFRMDGLTITSASNTPKNPAVYISVYEGEKEIFKGWIYSKFPTIHPFQHDRYKLVLIEGIKSKEKQT